MTKRITPLRAIRLKCLDCCAGQKGEVRQCSSLNCALFNFRMGKKSSQTKIRKKLIENRGFSAENPPSTDEKQE